MDKPCLHAEPDPKCPVCAGWKVGGKYEKLMAASGPPPYSGPCTHLGPATGERVLCPSCRGKVELKVFACEVHGVCTKNTKAAGVAGCCHACKDYRPPPLKSHGDQARAVKVVKQLARLGMASLGTSGSGLPALPVGPMPFEWVSTARLAADSVRLAGLLPPNTSGVVGLPRSGMIPASIIAAHLHLPLYELTEAGKVHRLSHGGRGQSLGFADANGGPLVVVDDTVYSGNSMWRARKAVQGLRLPAVFAAVYARVNATPSPSRAVDVYARELPSPHVLEWNCMNNGPLVGLSANPAYGTGLALDLDGIILHDESSGGKVGTPFLVPRSFPAPLVVTGRRESHRGVTEDQLRQAGARWQRLDMLPDGADGSAQGIATFKADRYGKSGCGFFLESEPVQAELIHYLTGRPVVCPAAGRVWQGGSSTPPPRPLLPPSAVAHVFEPLRGRLVGLVHNTASGNCGDRMIGVAAEQLLKHFKIDYRVVDAATPGDVDVLALFGGGNVGHDLCAPEEEIRQAALASGRPCVLLPQTTYRPYPEGRRFALAFAREATSRLYLFGSSLAPDLALCYRPSRPLTPPTAARGEFYTSSPEGLFQGRAPDPRSRFTDPEDYLAFVASHAEVVTDCLHAAVCSLAAGRKTTLLPTRLHKQRSMYDSWLRDLGCCWQESPDL